MGRMLNDRAREQGIENLNQGIPTAAEEGIHLLAEGA